MKHLRCGALLGIFTSTLLAGCSDEGYTAYGGEVEAQPAFGSAEHAVNACIGDDLQYDFNGFAASLAVAIANELRRWNVMTDFTVSNGKLALSSTGSAACGASGCANIKDILLLQEDATLGIPNHSPSVFRSKLVGWYNAQSARLTELAVESRLPNGSWQLMNRYSSKYLVVDAGSTADGAIVEQGPLNGDASNWETVVVGTKHKFKNRKSGKCLDLATASSMDNVNVVQKTCGTAATQSFDVVKIDGGFYALKTTYGKQVVAFNWGTGNDVRMVQVPYDQYNSNGHFRVTGVGGTTNPAASIVKAMYALSFENSPSTVMAPISSSEGAQVKLATYTASNPLHQWFAFPVNGKYQLINRGSGTCLALASDSSTALLVQRTCAATDTQLFGATALSRAEHFSLATKHGKFLEAQNAVAAAGTAVAQGNNIADPQRRIRFSPIAAAEPHKLTYSHTTNDAPCGDYKWYNITQPNGVTQASPEQTYMDLIFAGGKKALTGADENPFIAQLSAGTQVAIDPSGFMLPGAGNNSGSCIASDIFYDFAKSSAGKCCVKFSGATGVFAVSSWSPTTFLCR